MMKLRRPGNSINYLEGLNITRQTTCLLFLLIMTCLKQLQAQDKCPVKFGMVTAADFILPKSGLIDSSTGAVVIADVGSTSFKGNTLGGFTLVFKRQVRIKILNKRSFDLASDEILLYNPYPGIELIPTLEGATYNLENGRVIQTKLNSKDIFEERAGLSYKKKKFTLPAVNEGSVIEYTYMIESRMDFLLKEWTFQREKYPCLWSEYSVAIPSVNVYMFNHKGVDPFFIDKASEGMADYLIDVPSGDATLNKSYAVTTTTINHRWVMKDVPPFSTESYISCPSNYVDRISFQLSKTFDGEQYHDYSNSWSKVNQELMSEDDFGGPLKDNNNWIKEDIAKLAASNGDPLTTAKNIYYYIQHNFTCTNLYDKYIQTTLKDLYKRRSGGVGEINLLLTMMLKQAGISADPVLLSTRDYGFNSPGYPFLQKLNYVIVKTIISGRVYYLDASRPLYGFGKLSPDCYNGHARVFSLTFSTFFYLTADSLKEPTVTVVYINQDENDELKGKVNSKLGEIASHYLRERKDAPSRQAFIQQYQKSLGMRMDLEVVNLYIDSLDNVEAPVTTGYEFTIKKPSAEILYFNPMMDVAIKSNPFEAASRKFPIELPFLEDNLYVFTMGIPDGYTIDDYPKPVIINLSDGDARYEFLVEKSEDEFKLKRRLTFNKANFRPDEYELLRNFYIAIVKKESESIVFKKKK